MPGPEEIQQAAPAPPEGGAVNAPSTVPELEQILVKLQELDSRVGDLELQSAQDMGEQPSPEEGMEQDRMEKLRRAEKLKKHYESLVKRLREADELTGETEVTKNKKKLNPESAKMEVPQAETSEVHEDGTKTGAPVAGEETGDKFSKKAEDEAVRKVSKPSSEFPKMTVTKNTFGKEEYEDPTSTKKAGEEAPENPEAMRDKKGSKVPNNTYEEQYDSIRARIRKEDTDRALAQKVLKEKLSRLSERRSLVAVPGSDIAQGARNRAKETINEYLKISGCRF